MGLNLYLNCTYAPPLCIGLIVYLHDIYKSPLGQYLLFDLTQQYKMLKRTSFRTHSFDDSNPRLARKMNKKAMSNSTRRVSWHSGLEMVDGLGVLGSWKSGTSPMEVVNIRIIECTMHQMEHSLWVIEQGNENSPNIAELS